jgi:hypothetical protein
MTERCQTSLNALSAPQAQDVIVKAVVLHLGEVNVPGEQLKRETFVGYD